MATPTAFPIATRPANERPTTLSRDHRPPRPRTLSRARFERARALVLTPLEEVRALEARALTGLPLPTVLELEVPGWAGPIWVRAGDRGDRQGPSPSSDPTLDASAWEALVEAVAADRARPHDFRRLVERLAALPANAPDRGDAARREIAAWMDDVSPEQGPPRTLRVAHVLERIGARLFSVWVEPATVDEPAANGPSAA